MTTKTIRARALTTVRELVRGGDGKPRTCEKLCEVTKTSERVEVRLAGSFDRVVFAPAEKVRVRS